ncbi:kinase-like domain-containing protein [Gigaspora rosea]|uniref:Kinase-like domain-containing protein n=1 Tax=Gigaspora rosea TaxID=44941 RepID=A0A397VR59_9GLOM|nr:kinase-like domain-containing protein [Gigaspora rosea]
MIVMQYAKQGSLRKLLDRKFYQLTWMNKIENLLYIAEGLHAIHKDGFVHKDLHSGNIVNEDITSSYITDFGLCRPVSQDSSSGDLYGILPYIAPEVLKEVNKRYSAKSDIYSYGIIMSEIFNGYPPYHNIPHDIILASEIFSGRRPNIGRSVPKLLLDLMNKCLVDEPHERPDAKYLIDKLKLYRQDLTHKSELHKQVEGVKNIDYNKHELSYKTHEQAIFTSEFQKSFKLVNTSNKDFTEGSDGMILMLHRQI